MNMSLKTNTIENKNKSNPSKKKYLYLAKEASKTKDLKPVQGCKELENGKDEILMQICCTPNKIQRRMRRGSSPLSLTLHCCF